MEYGISIYSIDGIWNMMEYRPRETLAKLELFPKQNMESQWTSWMMGLDQLKKIGHLGHGLSILMTYLAHVGPHGFWLHHPAQARFTKATTSDRHLQAAALPRTHTGSDAPRHSFRRPVVSSGC